MSSWLNSNWRSARQVLVAQAAGDLVVAVEATHHEQLLGELRALRERVEGTVVQAGGDGELARPFRRGCPQQRRLDLDEPLPVHGGPDGSVHPGPQPQVALHARPAQVDVAVAQAHGLVGLGPVVDGERWRFGLVEHLDRAVADLHLARADARIDGALGPLPDGADDGDHPFVPHVGGVVDDALHDARVVAQVDEGEVLAVLPSPRHPAAQAHGGPHVGLGQHPAQVGAHGGGPVLVLVSVLVLGHVVPVSVSVSVSVRRCGCR